MATNFQFVEPLSVSRRSPRNRRGPASVRLQAAWRCRSIVRPVDHDQRQQAESPLHDVATSFPLVEHPSVRPRRQQQGVAQRPRAPPAASIGTRSASHVSSQQAESPLHDVATSFQLVEHPRVIPRCRPHDASRREHSRAGVRNGTAAKIPSGFNRGFPTRE